MPYRNMPKDSETQATMERCVKKVVSGGKPKQNAIPICYASIMGKGGKKGMMEEKKDVDEFILDPALLDPALLVEGLSVEECLEDSDKELSFMQIADEVRGAWNELHNPKDGSSNGWVAEVFPTKVIVEQTGKKFAYMYSRNERGEYVFGEPIEVEIEYLPKLKTWLKEQFDSLSSLLKPPTPPKLDPISLDVQKTHDGVMFYKDKDTGETRWLGVMSNKYRDRDNPAEILSAAAHKEFADAVNKGEWPYPELRLWHIAVPIGKADIIAYHDSGFQVAGGTIRKEAEPLLAYLEKVNFQWAMSHGMPKTEIWRDDPDPTVITRYRSKEVTCLPEWAAANELTLYKMTGGNEMAGFSEKDKERLTKMFGDSAAKVEALLTTLGEAADKAGVESKEVSEKDDGELEAALAELTPEEIEALQQLTPEELKAIQQMSPEEIDALANEEEVEIPSTEEVAEVIAPLAKDIETLKSQVEQLTKELAEFRGKYVTKETEVLSATPARSLAELIAASVTKSRDEATKVKGKESDMRGPVETKEKLPPVGAARIPFINEFMSPSGSA